MDEQLTPQAEQPPVTGVAAESQGPDWKARYIGMTKVLSERDKVIADLSAQLEQLNHQIAERDAAVTQTKTEFETQRAKWEESLNALRQEHENAQKQLSELSAYRLKMDTLKEFPDLLPLADTIPAMETADQMKQYLETLQKTLDSVAQEKAQRLTAGMVPGPASARTSPTTYPYATIDAWSKALTEAAGTPEYAQIANAYKGWLKTQT